MRIFVILITLAILIWLISAGLVSAAPFLVCDPQPGVTDYEITGDIVDIALPAEPNGSLKKDLEGIATGTHNLEIKACNVWDCSDPVPFFFTKSLPTLPTNIRLEP